MTAAEVGGMQAQPYKVVDCPMIYTYLKKKKP